MAFGITISKVFKSVKLKKRDYDPEIISIDDIVMPSIYMDMDFMITNAETKSELQTYKSLGYRFKKDEDLEVLEYHSYQIGIILNAFRLDIDLKISKPISYFHKNILSLDKKTIQGKVSDIIKKYDKIVNKTSSANLLKKDLVFTPLEASYLLYYLSFYKEMEIK